MPELDPANTPDTEHDSHAQLIAACVADILRKHSVIVPEYVSPEGASALTGISKRTLVNYRVRDDGGPPFYRVGGLVRYKVAELRAWVEAGRVAPQ